MCIRSDKHIDAEIERTTAAYQHLTTSQARQSFMPEIISELIFHHKRVVAELHSIEETEPLRHASLSPQQSGAVHP